MKPKSETLMHREWTLGEDAAGIRMLGIELNYHRREPEYDRPAMYRYFVCHYTLVTYDSDSSVCMRRSFCPFEVTARTVWSCDKGYRRSRKVEETLEEDFGFWTQKLVAEHCQKFGLPCPCLD